MNWHNNKLSYELAYDFHFENQHTHTRTHIDTGIHLRMHRRTAEERNVVAILEQPSQIKCELAAAAAPPAAGAAATIVAPTPAMVMRPFKARKCLHFCTFLLSHYAKYICIVCRCFSSSFDAYVLAS